ncbi:hypothetical protein [Microbacterium sp. No. 7]|uniref:hypothetical protein n=1 Tax=Microbacterium sp. No. 7 TaxID=1714373 RepID=UPI0006D013AD|nr:hypothetical protein [Microbacterium sp. No. 7]ALJ19529.1 hypothetical protein AOA12_06245 [Microbacterium sp. No. 7]
MSIKTPEQVADEQLSHFGIGVHDPSRAITAAAITAAIKADSAQRPTRRVHIVFDGPPAHESGRFVEVETPDGESISLGKWLRRPNGWWALEIEVPA